MADWRSHAASLKHTSNSRAEYTGPMAPTIQAFEDAPFEIGFKKEHTSRAEDSPSHIVRSTFKKVPCPGTEDWLYPKQSCTWNKLKNVWMAVNTYEDLHTKEMVTKSIKLREWINHYSVRTLMDDDKMIMHVAFKDANGKYISEDEAIAINDKFDPDKPVSTPRRVFQVGADGGGPSTTTTPTKRSAEEDEDAPGSGQSAETLAADAAAQPGLLAQARRIVARRK